MWKPQKLKVRTNLILKLVLRIMARLDATVAMGACVATLAVWHPLASPPLITVLNCALAQPLFVGVASATALLLPVDVSLTTTMFRQGNSTDSDLFFIATLGHA